MTLDPRERKSWEGLFDLLQPPQGYRLSAAVGTSFGLSIEALTAALLAMCDADGEELANDPVAGVMAMTRLQSKVRVLVHPGTVSGRAQIGSGRFVALLDRVVVEVEPPAGLFHPKVWALKFDRIGPSSSAEVPSVGRLLISSRNLSASTCFEMGAIFEGTPAPNSASGTRFSVDVAEALMSWLKSAKRRVPRDVWRLPQFVRQLTLDVPREGAEELRLRWQGGEGPSLAERLPKQFDRAVIVSPFLQPGFLTAMIPKAKHLQVVSTSESLDGLDDDTFRELDQVKVAQGSPVLYQVTQVGEPDGGFIDSIHAKLLLAEHDGGGATFIGSANATGPGWGLSKPANIEAMVEMRPGIGIDRFVTAFLRENKTKVHPWIEEYDRTARTDADPERETERQLLAALRQVARMDLELVYEEERQRLTVTRSGNKTTSLEQAYPDIAFDFAPLLLTDRGDAWTPVKSLTQRPVRFEDVPLEKLTAFVAVRARSKEPALERSRLVLARLNVSDADLDRRDALVRDEIMKTADPAAVLNALVRGLAYSPGAAQTREGRTGNHAQRLAALFQEANLERLLQAVAVDPTLISEMRLLLGPVAGVPFQRLCDDLEAVVARVHSETSP